MRRIIPLIVSISFLIGSLIGQNLPEDLNNNFGKDDQAIIIAHDFFFTISVNYEKVYPLNEKTKLGFRVGLGSNYGDRSMTAIGEGIFLYGKSKHFLEFGIGYQQPFYYYEEGPDPPSLAIMLGYRYQGKNGFIFKIYPEFLPAIFPDEDSWGHLPFLGFALGYAF